ncbi:MAG: relaxase/mobilization nuclease domain-containing protein [Clostridia bacterium]|nr:relaxase/mobilization nuclease domain-containing protein [Clostridia bacterium]
MAYKGAGAFAGAHREDLMPVIVEYYSRLNPKRGIDYITRKGTVELVDTLNLMDAMDPSEQFAETMAIYGKGAKKEDVKYFHFMISCFGDDDIPPKKVQEFSLEAVKRLFPGYECVVATHTDTDFVHSHIVVNAINPLTGKKLHYGVSEAFSASREVNLLAGEMGFPETNPDMPSRDKYSIREMYYIKSGKRSFLEDIRDAVYAAREEASSEEEFEKCLAGFGVEVGLGQGGDFVYRTSGMESVVRAKKLGIYYRRGEILNGFRRKNSDESAFASERRPVDVPGPGRKDEKDGEREEAFSVRTEPGGTSERGAGRSAGEDRGGNENENGLFDSGVPGRGYGGPGELRRKLDAFKEKYGLGEEKGESGKFVGEVPQVLDGGGEDQMPRRGESEDPGHRERSGNDEVGGSSAFDLRGESGRDDLGNDPRRRPEDPDGRTYEKTGGEPRKGGGEASKGPLGDDRDGREKDRGSVGGARRNGCEIGPERGGNEGRRGAPQKRGHYDGK